MLTSVPGSSDYYKGSVVVYSYQIKETLLDVNHDTILKYGVVSEQVVTEMAENAKKKLDSDYAISCSGIAGPSGGTTDKPVGTVWIAIATPERTIARKFIFGRNRQNNINVSATTALNMLRKELI